MRSAARRLSTLIAFLILSSSIPLYGQVSSNTPRCDGLTAHVARYGTPEDSTQALALLSLLDESRSIQERECAKATRDWFVQPRLSALSALYRYREVDSTARAWIASGPSQSLVGTVYKKWGYAAYRQGNYARADSLYALALRHFTERDAPAPQHRAEILTNWGWARHRLGRHQDALCKFEAALRVLNAACGSEGCENERVSFFRHEARRGRDSLYAADGNVNPLLCQGIDAETGRADRGAGIPTLAVLAVMLLTFTLMLVLIAVQASSQRRRLARTIKGD